MVAFMCLDIYILWHSNRKFSQKMHEEKKDDVFQLMMRTKDKEIVWDLLKKHVSRTQSFVTRFALEQFNRIVDGICNESLRDLRHCGSALKEEQSQLKKFRRKELLAMRRIPGDIAIERNTWLPRRKQQPAVRLLSEKNARAGKRTCGQQFQPYAKSLY